MRGIGEAPAHRQLANVQVSRHRIDEILAPALRAPPPYVFGDGLAGHIEDFAQVTRRQSVLTSDIGWIERLVGKVGFNVLYDAPQMDVPDGGAALLDAVGGERQGQFGRAFVQQLKIALAHSSAPLSLRPA